METTTVSSQGQILIPKKFREKIGLKPGVKVSLIPREYSIALIPHKKDWLRKAKGILKKGTEKGDVVKKLHQKFEEEWDEKR